MERGPAAQGDHTQASINYMYYLRGVPVLRNRLLDFFFPRSHDARSLIIAVSWRPALCLNNNNIIYLHVKLPTNLLVEPTLFL